MFGPTGEKSSLPHKKWGRAGSIHHMSEREVDIVWKGPIFNVLNLRQPQKLAVVQLHRSLHFDLDYSYSPSNCCCDGVL